MPRKSHKKSRQGCQECKRRHVKCDETHPRCVNCVTARLTCPFETREHVGSNYSPPLPGETTQHGSASVSSTLSDTPAGRSTIAASSQLATDPSLNMLHLELLYCWSTGIYKTFLLSRDIPEQGLNTYADVCIKYGLRHPFLMRQILATSALSLSLTRPDQRSIYHQHATQLQSEALADYHSVLERLDESNIVPAFLASSLIGLHTFCETIQYRDDNFNTTLDSLVSCINLLRGIRSLIGNWWPFLLSSELKPILVPAHEKRQQQIQQPYHFERLNQLIAATDIGAASREAYSKAIEELTLVYVIQAELEEPELDRSANMVFAWLVSVPKEYVELISARRPEALIILAHYAAILHRRRGFWPIQDAGEFLIKGISAYLGKHWEEYTAWPCSIIST